MIIECPKCKTQFEVNDNALKSSDVKFQCAECAFLWTEHINKKVKVEKNSSVSFKEEKLPSCLVEEKNENSNDKDNKILKACLKKENIMVFILAIVFCLVIFLVVQNVSNVNMDNNGKSVFDVSNNKDKSKELYIEIAKPLTLVKEGTNEYKEIELYSKQPLFITRKEIKSFVTRADFENIECDVNETYKKYNIARW